MNDWLIIIGIWGGIAAFVAAGFWIHPVVGFVVLGIGLLSLGYAAKCVADEKEKQ